MTLAQIFNALNQQPLLGERMQRDDYDQISDKIKAGREAFVERHLVR